MYEVTLWPILAAAVSNIVIGMIWYHPKVFGSAWMRLSNISPEVAEKSKKRMPIMVLFGFLASVVVAYVMDLFQISWGVYDWIGGGEIAFWIWFGFVAPILLGMVLWEGKSIKLYLIHAGHWLVALIAMGVILAL